ncbi:hypothetical protein JJD41_13225 [Oxynema sp. CENA135]|uniref:hypothetical protein n=1 Tax=Oxynema sp. CENA135 TaxID=984206 RepID=UPI001909DFB3|nr:hypothetical protein [Oxynema sp. CENA135]MBK4730818.1 hypothetical protein [Oxynema sp. CENA135]
MAKSANETLLAILLALENLETPLSADEQATLKKTGQRLTMHPKKWESATQKLLEAFESNASFQQCYQAALTQLENFQGNIPPELLPTEEELQQALPSEGKVVKRAYFEGQPDRVSNEILNVVTNVLKTSDPEIPLGKLSLSQRILAFFKSRNSQ